MTTPETPSEAPVRELVSSSEYARRCEVVKSRVSAWCGKGMPYVEGRDDHGRVCKFVDVAAADAWRALNLKPKMDGAGRMRGMPSNTSTRDTPRAPKGPAAEAKVSAPAAAKAPVAGPKRVWDFEAPPGLPPPELSARSSADDPVTKSAELAVIANQHRAQREADTSAMVRMKRLNLEGALLDREAALDAHEDFVRQVGVTLERVPADHATVLASELGCGEHEAFIALRRLIDSLREDLAIYAERERDRLGLAGGDEADAEADVEVEPA